MTLTDAQKQLQQKARDEESASVRKLIGDYHAREVAAFAQWVRIGDRTADDPEPGQFAISGIRGGAALTLRDGIYERQMPYYIKHWWRPDEEYPIKIQIKDGKGWVEALPQGFLRGVKEEAMIEAQKALTDFYRQAGVTTIVLSIGHPHPQRPDHRVQFEQKSDLRRKVRELDAILNNAKAKGMGMTWDASFEDFFRDYGNIIGQDKVNELYAKRDNLLTNPEGGPRAQEFLFAKEKMFDESQLGKLVNEDKDVQLKIKSINADDKKSAHVKTEEIRKVKAEAAAKMTTNFEEEYKKSLGGSNEKKLENINKELDSLDKRVELIEANRVKIEKNLERFDVAMKLGKDRADFPLIEENIKASSEARQQLLDQMKKYGDTSQNAVILKEELIKILEPLQKERKDLEAKKKVAEGMLEGDQSQKDAKAKALAEVETKLKTNSENTSKFNNALDKVTKVTETLNNKNQEVLKTEEKSKALPEQVKQMKEAYEQQRQQRAP